MDNVIRLPGTKTPNEFIKELGEKDIEYFVIAFKERGASDVQASWGNTTNSKLVHAASFLYDRIKRVVFG